ALGLEVQMLPGVGPKFPKPVDRVEDLSRLNWSVNVLYELSYVYEVISLTRHRLNGKVPLTDFTGAPWTLMSYVIKGSGSDTHSKAKRWLYTEPDASRRLLHLLTETVITHLVQQTVTGAQLLQVFESYAGALTPSLFPEFASPYPKKIVEGVRERLMKDHHLHADELPPLVVFAKDGHYALHDLVQCGYDVLSLDWTITPSEARNMMGDEIALQGNLDPCALYSSGSPIYVVDLNTVKLLEHEHGAKM
ncbi:uroporphyrinogen decarboxylase, partial [Paragonimus westermani]